MQPTVKSVTEIFQQRIRFVVPLFQRTYVWNIDEQWLPLWEDIERQAQRLLDVPHGAPFPPEANHFLGAIVVQREVGTTDGGPPTASVIDGQQRLTTLQVLLAAIRDYLRDQNHELVETLNALTSNTLPHACTADKFKVWPTNSDRKPYENAMSGGATSAYPSIGKPHLPSLCRAYLFFSEEFAKYVEQGGENSEGNASHTPDQRVKAVYNSLASAFRFVVIELDQSEDPQIIFESLNARGEPLLASDLIKNYIFLEASEADANRWYPEYWDAFETELASTSSERFWRQERELLRDRRPLIDVFFYTFLLESGDRFDIQPNHLYQEFKSWRTRQRHDISTEDLLARIRNRADLFRDILLGQRGARVKRTFDAMLAIDGFAAMPLLLHVLARRLPEAWEDALCAAIESFFVRRWFCSPRARNTSALVAKLLNIARNSNDRNLLDEVLNSLSRSATNGIYDWHDDTDFEHAWLIRPVYAKSRQERARWLLQVISNEAGGHLSDEKISVEHVMPQAADDHRYPFSDNTRSVQDNLQRRKRLVDTIGNLTLLETKLNRDAADRAFSEKLSIYRTKSSINLNRTIGEEFSAWGEDEIEKRGQMLFELAKGAWQKPPRD